MRAWRMHGHSALPYMLTRCKSAETSGSSAPLAARGFNGAASVAKALAGTRQADAPLVHAQDIGAEDDLMLVDEPFGAGRPQELTHLGGSRLAVFLALPAKPRVCKPSCGRRKRVGRDPAECAAWSLLA